MYEYEQVHKYVHVPVDDYDHVDEYDVDEYDHIDE